MTADFLVEIHTEELPPKSLRKLATAFREEIKNRLTQANLEFKTIQYFATPRRFAVIVQALSTQQPDTDIEKKGPALSAAYDANGQPTPACLGFAKSCGTKPDQLITLKNKQGEFVGFKQQVKGKMTEELIPEMIRQALQALPIAKRMRWGNHDIEFVRPVHSVILLLNDKIISAKILGCQSSNKTRGHRFMHPEWMTITSAKDYETRLEKEGYVIADFDKRKKIIQEQVINLSENKAIIHPDLLEEVTAIVEWPVAFQGNFDAKYLKVPQEALISAMQDHQRYFPMVDPESKLLPQFVAVSNLASKDSKQMIFGNERVLRARLADAAFFYGTDKKHSLAERLEKLKGIVFQAKLGTVYEKAERISNLSALIANKLNTVNKLNIDVTTAARAALLCKADLTTDLVGEFPELQGVAGYYYALHDGENEQIAIAIKEHYQPRFAQDELPKTLYGAVVAIADRLDTLIGIFGINLLPTGDKDPFGLRRAAMGVLRILIEKGLNLDVQELLQEAYQQYQIKLPNADVLQNVWAFMLDRLKPWYQEQAVSADIFAAVIALPNSKPYDLHRRIQAVKMFKGLPEAETLSIANKRVSNILTQYSQEIAAKEIDAKLFDQDAEKNLAENLTLQSEKIRQLANSGNYQEVLTTLTQLRDPVDNFFDHVLVMTEDKKQRENRLLLLKKLRELFLQVADIALLQ